MTGKLCDSCGEDMSSVPGQIGRSTHICPFCGYDHKDGTMKRSR